MIQVRISTHRARPYRSGLLNPFCFKPLENNFHKNKITSTAELILISPLKKQLKPWTGDGVLRLGTTAYLSRLTYEEF